MSEIENKKLQMSYDHRVADVLEKIELSTDKSGSDLWRDFSALVFIEQTQIAFLKKIKLNHYSRIKEAIKSNDMDIQIPALDGLLALRSAAHKTGMELDEIVKRNDAKPDKIKQTHSSSAETMETPRQGSSKKVLSFPKKKQPGPK